MLAKQYEKGCKSVLGHLPEGRAAIRFPGTSALHAEEVQLWPQHILQPNSRGFESEETLT